MLDRSATRAANTPQLVPDAFLQCVASGGDERLQLNEFGENKYYVKPVQLDVFNRGSCTCSPATRDGFDAAIALFDQLSENTIGFEEARLEQRNRLLRLNNADAKQTEVVFAPSGSDCCYFAPYLSATLWPNKRIINVVTCPEELGSGSILAHQAKYYSTISQVASSLPAGDRISASLDVDYRPLAARSDRGDIIDHTETIERIIEGAGSDCPRSADGAPRPRRATRSRRYRCADESKPESIEAGPSGDEVVGQGQLASSICGLSTAGWRHDRSEAVVSEGTARTMLGEGLPACPTSNEGSHARFVPGCYMGNVPPNEANLPATCDIARAVSVQPSRSARNL